MRHPNRHMNRHIDIFLRQIWGDCGQTAATHQFWASSKLPLVYASTIAFPERFWRCCKNKVLQPVNRVFSPKLRLVAFLFGCKIKIWKVAKLTNFLSQLKINSDSITHLASSVPPKLLNKKRHKSTRFVEFQSSN